MFLIRIVDTKYRVCKKGAEPCGIQTGIEAGVGREPRIGVVNGFPVGRGRLPAGRPKSRCTGGGVMLFKSGRTT